MAKTGSKKPKKATAKKLVKKTTIAVERGRGQAGTAPGFAASESKS